MTTSNDDMQQISPEEEVSQQAPSAPPQSTYNPSEHFIPVQGNQAYLPANQRIYWFRQEQKHGKIETQLLHLYPDYEATALKKVKKGFKEEEVEVTAKGFAVCFARVEDSEGGVGTGIGSEYKAEFDDFIEKAEKKAIARALGVLGYGTLDAMMEESEGRIADAPIDPSKAKQNGKPASTNTSSPPSMVPTLTPRPASTVKGNGQAPTSTKAPQPAPTPSPSGRSATVKLTEPEKRLFNGAWGILTQEEKKHLLSFSGVMEPDETTWTDRTYRALLSNMGNDEFKATENMKERIKSLSGLHPKAATYALRDRLPASIKGKKPDALTWKEAGLLISVFGDALPLEELGATLDERGQYLKTKIGVDYVLYLFYPNPEMSRDEEKLEQYRAYLRQQFLKNPDRLAFPTDVLERHEYILDTWLEGLANKQPLSA